MIQLLVRPLLGLSNSLVIRYSVKNIIRIRIRYYDQKK